MILGSYHMANNNLDVYNLQADNVLTKKRQKEIQHLVDLLAKFKPTKIALERRWHTKSDTVTQEKYKNYLAEKHTLSKSESEQIGFRLAKQLGHKQIYCIDSPGKFNFKAVVDYAQENGQVEYLVALNQFMENYMKEEQEFLAKHTIGEYLKRMNEPERIRGSHGLYISMCRIGKNLDYPAADLNADWYHRNVKIYSNLTRITSTPEDRILVIFGNGHAPILRDLVEYAPEYELVEVADYLE